MVGYFVLSHSDHATLNAIRHRMARHYAQMGTEVEIQHHQTGGVHGHRMAKLEIPNMQYGFDWAMEQQDTELAGLLCLAIAELLKRSGPYEDLTEMLRRIETDLNANTPLLARVILARGQLAANREGLDTAEELLLKAISVADSIDFVSVGIHARVSLAYTILRTNRLAEAMRVAEASVQAAEQAKDSYLLPSSLYCRGYVTYKSGETREALADLLAALRGFQRLGNRIREGECCGDLGEYYHTVGEPQRAKRYYEDAQAIAHEQGDKSALIRGQRRLAWLHIDGGDWVQAEEALHQGLDIARELGDLPGEGSLVGTLGTVAAAAGRFDEALDRIWEAEGIYRQQGNNEQSQKCQLNICVILEKLGRIEEASEVIDQFKGAENIPPFTRAMVELLEMKILIRGEEWRKAHALGLRVMPSLEKMQAWDHTIALNAYTAICEAALGSNPEPYLVKAEATLKRLNLAENSPDGTVLMESRAQATELYSRFDPSLEPQA
jgi:tetratricopeptide (TPR) repeat protein